MSFRPRLGLGIVGACAGALALVVACRGPVAPQATEGAVARPQLIIPAAAPPLDVAAATAAFTHKVGINWTDPLFWGAKRLKAAQARYRLMQAAIGAEWSVTLGQGTDSAPGYRHIGYSGPNPGANDRLYILGTGNSGTNQVFVLNPTTGATLASWNVLGAIGSTGSFQRTAAVVSAEGARLYLATTDGRLAVVNAQDGSIIWSQKVSNAGFAGMSPFVDYSGGGGNPLGSQEYVHITSRDGSVYRLESGNHHVLSAWPAYNGSDQPLHPAAPSIDYGGNVTMTGSPIAWNREVWAGDSLGRMHRIRLASGTPELTTYQATGESTVDTGAGRSIFAPPAFDFDNNLAVSQVFVPAGDKVAWINPSAPVQTAVRWSAALAVDKATPIAGDVAGYTYSAPTELGPYYAADHISVARLAPSGGRPQEWGAANSTNGSYALENLPSRIARAPSGLFYIPSRGADAITKFNPTNNARTVIQNVTQQVFNAGTGTHQIIRVADGSFWVTNESARTLMHYDAAGAILATVSTGPTLQPRWISQDGAGKLWVSCTNQNTVLRFSSTGVLEATLPTTHSAVPITSGSGPNHMERSPTTGHVWAMQSGRNALAVADLSGAGSLVGTWPVSTLTNARVVGFDFDAAGQVWAGLSTANEVIRMAPDGSVAVRQPVSATVSSYAFDRASSTHWVGLQTNQVRKWDLGFTTATNIALSSRPTFMRVAADGAVWACLASASRVARVTPAGAITYFTLSGTPGRLALDPSGRCWVTSNNNTLWRLQADGSQAGPFATEQAPRGIAFDGTGRPWVACDTGACLQAFNATSGAEEELYPSTDGPHGLIFDASNRPWCTTSTGQRYFLTPTSTTYLDAPQGIATDGAGGFWVANGNGRHVLRLSAAGLPLGEARTGDGPYALLRTPGGLYWASNNAGNTVTRFNGSGVVQATLAVGSRPQGLALAADGTLWVANNSGNTVSRVSTGDVVTTHGPPSGFTWNGPRHLAVNSAGEVWVTMSSDDVLIRLDAAGNQQASKGLFGQTTPVGIAINAADEPWVACSGTRKVVRLLLTGGYFDDPIDAAVDGTGRVWVTNNGNATVSVIASDDSLEGSHVVGTNPRGVAVAPDGHVWVANQGSHNVTKLASDGSLVANFAQGAGSAPYGLTTTSDGRIWVACQGTNQVRVLNGAGALLATVAVGSQPANLTVGPSGMVWVANQGSNTVSRINPAGYAVSHFPVGAGPIDVVEAPSGEVWVANRTGGNLSRLRADGSAIEAYRIAAQVHGLSFNAAGDNLYAVGENNDTLYRVAMAFPLDMLAAATDYETPGDGNDSKAFLRFSYVDGAFGRRLPIAARVALSPTRSTTGNETYELWPTNFLHPGTPNTLWRGYNTGGTRVSYANPPETTGPNRNAYTGAVVASDYSTALPSISLELGPEQVPGDGPNRIGDEANHYLSIGFRTLGKPLLDAGHFYSARAENGNARPRLYVTVAGGASYPSTHAMRAWVGIDSNTQKLYGVSTNAAWELNWSSTNAFSQRNQARFNLTSAGRGSGPVSGGVYQMPRGNVLLAGDRLLVGDHNPTGNRFTINSYQLPFNGTDRLVKTFDGGAGSGELGQAMLYDFVGGSVYAASSTGRVVRVKAF